MGFWVRPIRGPILLLSTLAQLYCRSTVCGSRKFSGGVIPLRKSTDIPLQYYAVFLPKINYSINPLYAEVGTPELEKLLDTGNIQLIDVREPEELIATGQIPSSVNIPCK